MQNNLEFLDILAMVSFALQIQNYQELKKQATNDQVIDELHVDINRLEYKIDQVLQLLHSLEIPQM